MNYVHALRFRFLTPLYDAVVAIGMRDKVFKRKLIDQAGIAEGMRVLDVGCGTGTLTILGRQAHPHAEFTGIDGDPEILTTARRKAATAGLSVRFDHGLADALPYPDASFDRVVSSLLFHHLVPEQKRRAFREIRRVLAANGQLHIADFGRPEGIYASVVSSVLARFDGIENTRDNFEGRLPAMLVDSGFTVHERQRFATSFGTVSLLAATRIPITTGDES
jgi:ubiquinone/menaquinone biosynthesis C-methylase UbiE